MTTHETRDVTDYARLHWRFGWWSLLTFSAFGLALEAFQGFKYGAYLNVSSETRRLMWTLAHSHGTLMSVINLIFACSLRLFPELAPRKTPLASVCLLLGSVLVPAGFFAGGVVVYGGDPGIGILLLPPGAALFLIVLFLLANAEIVETTAQKSRSLRP